MAAPQFVPAATLTDGFVYRSPDHVPAPWRADRPADRDTRPGLTRLGHQGPDQGYALLLAELLRPELHLQTGERADDALRGAMVIALRRASMFGRAPTVHDLRLALTVWGFLDADPAPELVDERRHRFDGVADVGHHYDQLRDLADSVPEATLRMAPAQVASAGRGGWRQLLGLTYAAASSAGGSSSVG